MSAPAPAAADLATPETRTPRQALQRAGTWIALAALAVLVAVASLAVSGAARQGDALAPDNPAPGGTQALARVLQAEGVEVTLATTLEEARAAVGDGDDATLVLGATSDRLDDERLAEVGRLSTRTVLLAPDFRTLQAIAPDVAAGGAAESADRALDAACALPAATAAGSVPDDAPVFRYLGDDRAAAVACFPDDTGDASALLQVPATLAPGGTVTVLGADPILTNDRIAEQGSAALALGVLGERPRLVWYTPSPDDAAGDAPPTLGELTPGWVTPAILLTGAAALAAAVWRGRRFGPLVVERLPVVVRADETAEGRARLYQRADARGHALDALRVGTVDRIASTLALGRLASVDDVVAASAAALHEDPAGIRALLLDDRPRTDRDLVDLAGRLAALEHRVARAADPTDPTDPTVPTRRMDP
ncbi:DUF4350 domain-containing protein [Clavibacter michiganensis]|nr:DUF4350 domain-containing protein [Clavibacter michiganensis]AWG00819.1 hypothetical protein BEH62_04310 [Clavibacter michiganensis subsp. insidiosus]OQJ60592.1 hypothetical protein B5P21_12215 [Clavibacter michiganensis subsp. insidiosus]RMC87301.1 DUF4350 domain-containing protein [Clavibacter michiganensis subsp. insidiosus]